MASTRVMKFSGIFTILVFTVLVCSVVQAVPYASSVVSYNQGVAVDPNYTNASVVLGAPATMDSYMTPITVDYGSWEPTDVLNLGNGGSVTIAFDHPVVNNPEDVEYGTDLLVFGNSFFISPWWLGTPEITELSAEPATIEVSQDGINYYEIADTYADAMYPYTASKGNFLHATPAGIDYLGRLPGEVEADYLAGCGGTQVDISDAVGVPAELEWIMYVRVTDIAGDSGLADVVGFSDVVPEPATMFILLAGLGFIRRRK